MEGPASERASDSANPSQSQGWNPDPLLLGLLFSSQLHNDNCSKGSRDIPQPGCHRKDSGVGRTLSIPPTLRSQSRGNHGRRAGNGGERLLRDDSQQWWSASLKPATTQLYDILEKARLWRWQKDQWLPGAGGKERWTGRAQRIFKALKLRYDTIMVVTCHYTLIQTHRMCTNQPRALM